jgi:hypothetical protein
MMNRSSSLSLRGAALSAFTVLAAISLVLGGCVEDRQIGGEGGSGGTTTGTQGTTAGTGSTDSCTSFPDDAPLGKVTFTVKNNQAAPIYITGPWCFRRFSIAASPGAAFQDGERPTSEGTCETPIPPPLDCLGDSAAPIEPGGTLALEWNGLVYAKAALPAGCPAPADPQTLECYQGTAPESGTLEVRVDISPTAEMCDANMQNCLATGELFFAKKTFAYPGETQVQIDVD